MRDSCKVIVIEHVEEKLRNTNKRVGDLENNKYLSYNQKADSFECKLKRHEEMLQDIADRLQEASEEKRREVIRGKYQEEWDNCTHKGKLTMSCFLLCDSCDYCSKEKERFNTTYCCLIFKNNVNKGAFFFNGYSWLATRSTGDMTLNYCPFCGGKVKEEK